MNSKPLFSVVIPAYNRMKEIPNAISSVLAQTIQDFEIWVIDDGSEDNTKASVESFSDERIHYVYQNNSGATVARNNGIMHANGIYVSFLDSDDVWHPQMLERQLHKYESDIDIGFVTANFHLMFSDGHIEPFGRKLGVEGYAYKEVLTQGYLVPTSMLSAKRECFFTVGLFDEKLPASQDDDICFKLSKVYKSAFIKEDSASLNIGDGPRISSCSNRVARGWWMLWNKYEADVIEFCGKEVMASHYYECILKMALAKNKELLNEAIAKYISMGGRISHFKVSLLSIICTTRGIIQRVCLKLFRII